LGKTDGQKRRPKDRRKPVPKEKFHAVTETKSAEHCKKTGGRKTPKREEEKKRN